MCQCVISESVTCVSTGARGVNICDKRCKYTAISVSTCIYVRCNICLDSKYT